MPLLTSTTRRLITTALFGALSAHLACSSHSDTQPTPGEDMQQVVDAGVDAGLDMPAEDLGDDLGGEDLGGGEDSGADMPPPRQCTTAGECESGEICGGGVCLEPVACDEARRHVTCRRAIKDLGVTDEDYLDRLYCNVQRGECMEGCVRDAECTGDGEVCGDDGLCSPFLGELTGEDPGGGARAPFRAGVGNTLMHFPIGLPLGGYGSRAGNDGGRYSEALVASHGQMHGLYARAMLLDSGDRQLMLIRMPIIFPTGPMLEMVARALQEKTGKDWRNSLVISGTHTHSGPGRFLHLPAPDDVSLPLGAFGTDNFHDQAFEWIVDSAVEAAELALNDLSDAKLGWEIVESFDTDDQIASDRWSATPPFDDNRILLMRVDDLDDAPRALLFSFGMHGTYFDSGYASGDSMGGIEKALEEKFGEEYDRYVPTLFFNQNGGTMSPRGDRQGHRENHKFEKIGHRFVEHVWEDIEAVETDREVSLGGETLRFPLGYDELDYEPDEWTQILGPDGDLRFGGLQCNVAGEEDDDYSSHQEPGTTKCIGIDHTMYNRPPTLFLRSQMTALDIDGLTIVTLPGEASMELGWQVVREVAKTHEIDLFNLWTWGYAQDHQFYLTPSNLRGELPPWPGISTPMAPDAYPDYAFSYYQGGYEAGFTIWGARMGDYLVARAIDATGRLLGEPLNLPYEEPLPTQYSPRGSEPFPVESTPDALIGRVTQQPPAQVERFEAIEFAWVGGDPGAEMPQAPSVTLEARQPNGEFVAVMQPNTRPYDNRDHLMLTRLRLDEEDARREWVIYWEELEDFELGTYRFRADGHRLNDAGERVSYMTTSEPFEVVPSKSLSFYEVSIVGDRMLSAALGYPAAGEIKSDAGGRKDPAKVRGSYRMRHPDVPSGQQAPPRGVDRTMVSARLRPLGAGEDAWVEVVDGAQSVGVSPETVEGRSGVPVARVGVDLSGLGLTPGEYEVELSVVDLFGNTGTTSAQVTLAP